MTVIYRNTGVATGNVDHSGAFPLNPAFPSGGQSQDLNVLSIVALGTTKNGPWKRPDTPAGWTLITAAAGANWNTVEHPGADVTYWQYTKVGAYTGSLGDITWSGTGSMPTYAIAAIDILGCAVGETWDYSVYGWGLDVGRKGNLNTCYGTLDSRGPDHNHEATSKRYGTQASGRIDTTVNDIIFVVSLFNTANSGYPISQWNGLLITSNTSKFNPGSGQTATYTNVDNSWVGSWPYSGGLTLIRSYAQITSARAPYGSPSYFTPLYNASCGSTIFTRFTVREKSTTDARTISDKLIRHGLSSEDTGTGTEGTRDNGGLNANQNFDTNVDNWTGQNGATLTLSAEQYHNGASSMIVTPSGSQTTPQAVSEEIAVIPNNYYKAHAWMRGNAQSLGVGFLWYNSAHTLISTTIALEVSTINAWREYTFRTAAPPGAAYVRLLVRCCTNGGCTSNVSAGAFWYVDEAYISDGSVFQPTVPYPRRWTNGTKPTAEMLNADWRDTFKWFLGESKPLFVGTSTDTTNWTVATWYPIPINNVSNRIGFKHMLGDTKIWVTEDGWYEVLACTTRDSTGAGTTAKDITSIRRNGTGGYIMGYHSPHITDQDKINTADPVNIYLSAGDYIELAVWSQAAQNTVKSWGGQADVEPKIEIRWVER